MGEVLGLSLIFTVAKIPHVDSLSSSFFQWVPGVSDSSLRLVADYVGVCPETWPGSARRSEISHQNKPTDTPLSCSHLTRHRYMWQSTHWTPQPSSSRHWLDALEPQVWSGQEQLYTCMQAGVWGEGSPGMSTILCASSRSLGSATEPCTLFEKFHLCADANCISSDVLPLASAQPENLLSGL